MPLLPQNSSLPQNTDDTLRYRVSGFTISPEQPSLRLYIIKIPETLATSTIAPDGKQSDGNYPGKITEKSIASASRSLSFTRSSHIAVAVLASGATAHADGNSHAAAVSWEQEFTP